MWTAYEAWPCRWITIKAFPSSHHQDAPCPESGHSTPDLPLHPDCGPVSQTSAKTQRVLRLSSGVCSALSAFVASHTISVSRFSFPPVSVFLLVYCYWKEFIGTEKSSSTVLQQLNWRQACHRLKTHLQSSRTVSWLNLTWCHVHRLRWQMPTFSICHVKIY